MIISGKPIQNAIKVYGEQNQVTKNNKTSKKSIYQEKDEFILSSGAQEFSPMFNAIKGMPDARPEKVKEFSEEIDAGTYHVNSEGTAEKMLRINTGR